MSDWPRILEPLLRPANARQRRATYVAIAGAVAIVALVHEVMQGRPIFPVDDAYITLHNALVLTTGKEASYDAPALVGATSPAHVFLVALLAKLMPALYALESAAWLAVGAYAIGLAYVAFSSGGSVAVAAGATVVGLIAGQTPHQLLNGLETGLALAVVTFAVGVAIGDEVGDRPRSRFTLPVLCGLMPFARPELAALSGLLLLGRWYGARARTRAFAELVARDVVVAAVAALPIFLLCWRITGSPMPNTVAAKKFFFAEGCAPAVEKLTNTVSSIGDFVATFGLFSLAAIALWKTRTGRVGLAFGAVFFTAYFVELPGALAHYEQRYVYVLVPFFVLGAVTAASDANKAWRAAGAFVLVAGLLESAEHLPERWRFHMGTRRFTQFELADVASFVESHTQPSDTILIHDAGYISFATDRHLVDLVGLKTPPNATRHRDITWRTCGRDRGEAVAQIARDAHATYLVALGGWDDIFHITDSLRAHGWTLELLRPPPAAYRVYRISPP